jgi:hypothetical protein
MKIIRKKNRLVAGLLGLMSITGNLDAQSINVPTLEVKKGATAKLILSFIPGGTVSNFDFTLTYDPTIIDEASITLSCNPLIIGLTVLNCAVNHEKKQVRGIGTNFSNTALGAGDFAIINLPVKDTAAHNSYVYPFSAHFADASSVVPLDTTWTLNIVPDYCNLKVYSNVTESQSVMLEACEHLIIGPGFTAEDGASIMLSSGLDIELIPGISINKGASLNAAVCGQSLCATSSDPMPQGCHSCVVQICDDMPSCCDKEYTQECVDKVDSTCNLECQ